MLEQQNSCESLQRTLSKEIPRELYNLGTHPSPILPVPLSSLLIFGVLQHLIGFFPHVQGGRSAQAVELQLLLVVVAC